MSETIYSEYEDYASVRKQKEGIAKILKCPANKAWERSRKLIRDIEKIKIDGAVLLASNTSNTPEAKKAEQNFRDALEKLEALI